jgi:hypothetical protein
MPSLHLAKKISRLEYQRNYRKTKKFKDTDRRYYLNNTAMNGTQTYMQNNNGNAMTTTAAVVMTYLNDRLEEN